VTGAWRFNMGCGASTTNPATKYAEADPPPAPLPKKEPPAVTPSSAAAPSHQSGALDDGVIKGARLGCEHDAVFSSASDGNGVADRIVDELKKVGYRIGQGPTALASSKSVVLCLSPEFFSSSKCCEDLCTAVDLGLSVVLVVVEGSTWNGKNNPDPSNVPEAVSCDEGRLLRPRNAFASVVAAAGHGMLEHSRTYFEPFLLQLRAQLGVPSDAAKVQERLSAQHETSMMIRQTTQRFSESDTEAERPIDVLVDLGDGSSDASDCGITLLRPGMTLAQMRASMIADNAPEEGEDEEDAAFRVLASGKFVFLRLVDGDRGPP